MDDNRMVFKKRKMADVRRIKGAVDLISNLPDEILKHILFFVPTTKVAISTSLLSRRWRNLWREVPSISLDVDTLTAASVNETLTRYTAPNTKSFHLSITPITANIPYVDIEKLIKFAMSHNVENLFLNSNRHCYDYKPPDFFYNTSSFKQLHMLSCDLTIVPPVSWTSLRNLYLGFCRLSDESMAKILSGCPALENLTLYHCRQLNVLDLGKSLSLRTLHVLGSKTGPEKIVAPHIHYLRLVDPQLSCSLVDIASLTEAKLEISCVSLNPDVFRVLEMLDKLKNAEKLKLGRDFIQILSLAEIRGVPSPMFKVKVLTLDTVICQYVIPGIERLLQNSPDLEKLIISGRNCNTILELDEYLKSQSMNTNQCWRSKDGFSWNNSCWSLQPKHVTSFVELVLKNTEKLDKMVVLLDERWVKFKAEDVVVPTLSPNHRNVTIVPSSTNKLFDII